MQGLISSQIDKPQTNPEDSPEVVAENIYNVSMKTNDAALEDYRQRLSEAQHKYDHIRELRDKAEDRLETKDHTYKECYQSTSLFY